MGIIEPNKKTIGVIMYFSHDGVLQIKLAAVTLKEAGIKVPDQLKSWHAERLSR